MVAASNAAKVQVVISVTNSEMTITAEWPGGESTTSTVSRDPAPPEAAVPDALKIVEALEAEAEAKASQLKRIGELFDECAEDDPVRRRAVVQAIVNRVIDSPSDLTAAEATDVALALAAAAAATGPQSALQALLDRDPKEPLPPAA